LAALSKSRLVRTQQDSLVLAHERFNKPCHGYIGTIIRQAPFMILLPTKSIRDQLSNKAAPIKIAEAILMHHDYKGCFSGCYSNIKCISGVESSCANTGKSYSGMEFYSFKICNETWNRNTAF